MAFEVDLLGKRVLRLHPVLSQLIPPSEGWAGLVKAGQYIRVQDTRGRQCADFWAFIAADMDEHLSAMHTRVWVNRLCPVPGIDVVCAVSACPQQFNSISGWFPSEVQIDVFEPSADRPE